MARIGLRAWVAIVADGAIDLVRIAARARGGNARARIMALIQCNTRDGVGTRARSRLAGIGLCASIAVVACGPIGLDRSAARAG